ncbi:MAG: hypothetical protein A2X86_15450 [Bdellovibrionales bacterium GWA2_49_15]|nr:MAG: hypothetical protein A2X86_15450 [Bdellovibrionales bacterium GWA2_49_15]HAZ14525.1 hypothetical protein [Bdellovibrionales bacterium]
MRALLATSQITYVPDNYAPLFKELLPKHAHQIKGIILLQNLNFSVVTKALGLYAMGARRTGRGFLHNILKASVRLDPREELARKFNIPIYKFESMNCDKALQLVKNLEIDVVVNMRTRCIYKRPILEAPRLGCLNIHHGLLPEYRGTLCDLYALSQGRPAGFSIHHMVEKVDAGVLYKRCEVSQGDKNYQEYLKRSAGAEAKALSEIFSYVEKEGRLPEPLAISSSTPHHYSKTPNKNQIRAMIDQGLIL